MNCDTTTFKRRSKQILSSDRLYKKTRPIIQILDKLVIMIRLLHTIEFVLNHDISLPQLLILVLTTKHESYYYQITLFGLVYMLVAVL